MLTRLKIRNFKRFDDVEIELGKSVVFIGPNNSGKTTALQALALWEVGLHLWNSKRGGKASPEKRPGVTINRRDLIPIPVPVANLLWRGVHVRNIRKANGKTHTGNIRIDISVDGITNDRPWTCGFEFDYSNEESFVCRPLRLAGYEDMPVKDAKFSTIAEEAEKVRVAYLPPMSGLASEEPKWEPGRINVLLGQGQTAQVLRNLCHRIYEQAADTPDWLDIVQRIKELFGVTLSPPKYVVGRGEITMEYEENGDLLDLSSAGRGLQQTLLLLAHLYANPQTVLLLDEPDAHLEILRQRQTFRLLTDVAGRQQSQIIAASHSEVVLAEAAGSGRVVAFVGKPHTMNDRGSQLIKALSDIGWDQYYLAEETGWLLCLEGATDLAILRKLAELLQHPAAQLLERPFVHYVATNLPQKARSLFYGLCEAKPDFVGVAIFDRLTEPLQTDRPLTELMWNRRELENYLCRRDVLMAYAKHGQDDDLFGMTERDRRSRAMEEAIDEVAQASATLGRPDPWSPDVKATDEFLDPVFKRFFAKLGLPLVFRKSDYHFLANFLPVTDIDPEIADKLDRIVTVAKQAHPKNI
jgi:ABC-type taurine transport system ATPase subunit